MLTNSETLKCRVLIFEREKLPPVSLRHHFIIKYVGDESMVYTPGYKGYRKPIVI